MCDLAACRAYITGRHVARQAQVAPHLPPGRAASLKSGQPKQQQQPSNKQNQNWQAIATQPSKPKQPVSAQDRTAAASEPPPSRLARAYWDFTRAAPRRTRRRTRHGCCQIRCILAGQDIRPSPGEPRPARAWWGAPERRRRDRARGGGQGPGPDQSGRRLDLGGGARSDKVGKGGGSATHGGRAQSSG